MHTNHYIKYSIIFTLISVASLIFAAWASYAVIFYDAKIYEENDIIENTQAALLIFSCIFYLFNSLEDKSSKRYISLSLSLLCYIFLLREVNVKRLDVPEILKFFGSGWGRNISYLVGITYILFAIYKRGFLNFKNTLIVFLKSPQSKLLFYAGGLLILGDIFEKNSHLSFHMFFEEISEFFGYVLILISAIYQHYYFIGEKYKAQS